MSRNNLLMGGSGCNLDTAKAMFHLQGPERWDFFVTTEFSEGVGSWVSVYCRSMSILHALSALLGNLVVAEDTPFDEFSFPDIELPNEPETFSRLMELDETGQIWYDLYGESTDILFEAQ